MSELPSHMSSCNRIRGTWKLSKSKNKIVLLIYCVLGIRSFEKAHRGLTPPINRLWLFIYSWKMSICYDILFVVNTGKVINLHGLHSQIWWMWAFEISINMKDSKRDDDYNFWYKHLFKNKSIVCLVASIAHIESESTSTKESISFNRG